jgi:hypothetical protein
MRFKTIGRVVLCWAISGIGACADSSPDQGQSPGQSQAIQLPSCAGIMPLGDSITAGVNGGYRNNLYTGLQQNNCGVSFAGTP